MDVVSKVYQNLLKQHVFLNKYDEQARRKSDRKDCECMRAQKKAKQAHAQLVIKDATGREEPTYSSERVRQNCGRMTEPAY